MAKKKFELNRKDYLNIKKMDHHQMSLWAESMYKSGFEDGEKEADKVSFTSEELYQTLADIKGLGEKRISAICEALENVMTLRREQDVKA